MGAGDVIVRSQRRAGPHRHRLLPDRGVAGTADQTCVEVGQPGVEGQDSITPAESRSRIGTEGNPELVTQDEIFQNEIPSRSKAEEETAEHQ
jgi:hypothetical protein